MRWRCREWRCVCRPLVVVHCFSSRGVIAHPIPTHSQVAAVTAAAAGELQSLDATLSRPCGRLLRRPVRRSGELGTGGGGCAGED